MTLRLSQHAHERLMQRFGWSGDIETAARQLAQAAPTIAAACAMMEGVHRRDCRVRVPQLDMVAAIRGGVVVTVVMAETEEAHRARRRNITRSKASAFKGGRKGGLQSVRGRRREGREGEDE